MLQLKYSGCTQDDPIQQRSESLVDLVISIKDFTKDFSKDFTKDFYLVVSINNYAKDFFHSTKKRPEISACPKEDTPKRKCTKLTNVQAAMPSTNMAPFLLWDRNVSKLYQHCFPACCVINMVEITYMYVIPYMVCNSRLTYSLYGSKTSVRSSLRAPSSVIKCFVHVVCRN